MSEPNEDFSTGRTRELEDAGFKPIKVHLENDAVTSATSGDEISKPDAAEKIRARSEPEKPILERKWIGEPDAMFEDAQTAAAFLKAGRDAHAQEAIPQRASEDQSLRDQIDALRGEPTDAEKYAAATAEGTRQAQAEQAAQDQHHAAQAQAQEAAYQAKAAQFDHVAERIRAQQLGLVSIVAHEYPELAALTPEQIPTAVAALEQSNPQRATQLKERIQTAHALRQQLDAVQRHKTQHENAQHSQYVRAEAQAFDRTIANDPRRDSVLAGVRDLLANNGIDPVAYAQAGLQGGELGRLLASAQVQSLLYNAAAAMLDAKSHRSSNQDLKAKLAKLDVPHVQAPGTSVPRSSPGQANLQSLSAKLSKSSGDAALRAAAALLSARRAGGR